MWSIGYAFERDDLERWRAQAVRRDGEFVGRFARLAEDLRLAIAVTYLERGPSGPRNTLTLFDSRGREALTYAKVHTCAFDRPEVALATGDAFAVADLDTAAGPVRLGAMICFDREFPEAHGARSGVEVRDRERVARRKRHLRAVERAGVHLGVRQRLAAAAVEQR